MVPISSDQSISACQTNLPGLWSGWLYLIIFDQKKKNIIEFIIRSRCCGGIKYNKREENQRHGSVRSTSSRVSSSKDSRNAWSHCRYLKMLDDALRCLNAFGYWKRQGNRFHTRESRMNTPCQHLDFSPVRLILDVRPPELFMSLCDISLDLPFCQSGRNDLNSPTWPCLGWSSWPYPSQALFWCFYNFRNWEVCSYELCCHLFYVLCLYFGARQIVCWDTKPGRGKLCRNSKPGEQHLFTQGHI